MSCFIYCGKAVRLTSFRLEDAKGVDCGPKIRWIVGEVTPSAVKLLHVALKAEQGKI
jgi:hypothetical protein